MMRPHFIAATTMNELIFKALDTISHDGIRTPSRNGETSTLYNTFFTLTNPRSRHLNLKGRKNNVFAMIAETFWVLAGHDALDPVMTFFLPRAKDFSDDGITWRGAYGPRLYLYNQLEDAVRVFHEEGLESRRSVIAIYLPERDTKESLKEIYHLENTKDRPCNNLLHFFVTPDQKLHMNVYQRSGDVVWGMGSINVFEWTVLHEFVTGEVRRRSSKDVTLGTYNHFVTNLHLYDFTGEQGRAVLENKDAHDFTSENTKPLIFPEGVDGMRRFATDLLATYAHAIESKERNHETLMREVRGVFDFHKVSCNGNLLPAYAELAAAYITTKNGNPDVSVSLEGHDEEFVSSVRDSHFRKFKLV